MNGLKYLMFVADKQHKEVGDVCEVSSQMVTNWVREVKPISKRHLPILANYFGVEVKYIDKELSLQDKVEIELQLASKSGEYVDIDFQATKLHRQNEAVKDKYFSVLEALEDYANKFEQVKKEVNEFHLRSVELLRISSLMDDPGGCVKVYALLQQLQGIRGLLKVNDKEKHQVSRN